MPQTLSRISQDVARYAMQHGADPIVLPDGSLRDGCAESFKGLFWQAQASLPDGRKADIYFRNHNHAGVEDPTQNATLEIRLHPTGSLPGFMTREFGLTGICRLITKIEATGQEVPLFASTANAAVKQPFQKKYEEIIGQVHAAFYGGSA